MFSIFFVGKGCSSGATTTCNTAASSIVISYVRCGMPMKNAESCVRAEVYILVKKTKDAAEKD
jgi:hypothetical protein